MFINHPRRQKERMRRKENGTMLVHLLNKKCISSNEQERWKEKLSRHFDLHENISLNVC